MLLVTNETISHGSRVVPASSEVNRISPPPFNAGYVPSASNISDGRLSSVSSTGKFVRVSSTSAASMTISHLRPQSSGKTFCDVPASEKVAGVRLVLWVAAIQASANA